MQELLAQLRARAAQQATKAKAQSQQAQEPTPIASAGDAEPTAAPTAEADLSSHVAAFTNTTDYLGRTPLMLAVIGGRTKALQVLLADPSTDVEARAKVRSSARVRGMNTRRTTNPCLARCCDQNGWTTLLFAAHYKRTRAAQLLVNTGRAHVNAEGKTVKP